MDTVRDPSPSVLFATSSQPQSDEWKSYNTEFGFIQENVDSVDSEKNVRAVVFLSGRRSADRRASLVQASARRPFFELIVVPDHNDERARLASVSQPLIYPYWRQSWTAKDGLGHAELASRAPFLKNG